MAIDFFEKEMKRLTIRFNRVFRDRIVCDLKARDLAILALIRTRMLIRSIRNRPDEKQIAALTREFYQAREIMNKFFDLMEPEKERSSYGNQEESRRFVAGG
jgi:hypothetical protein